jgi:hypothetical protein
MPKFREMNLDEARAVKWPYGKLYDHTIGSLLDRGLLSPGELGEAIERAQDARLREASRIVLSYELSQDRLKPKNVLGPLNVVTVERRSFAERRQILIAMAMGAIMSALMLSAIGLFIWSVIDWLQRDTSENESIGSLLSKPAGIVALVIVILIACVGFFLLGYVFPKLLDRLIFDPLYKQMRLYRKGQLGEERALNVMYGALDGKWWLFRNLELPGRRIGDLDLVLVGPHGVWNLEVKAYSGEYRNVGDRWERRANGSWHPIRKSPTQQARRNAAQLSQLLSTNQIKQWITPAIIWANPESSVLLDNPSSPVWTLDELSDQLKALSSERPIGQEQVQKIVGVLKKISEESDLGE